MSLILGLSGDAGAGKDTVADVLVSEHGFVKIALADPLKRFLMEAFLFTRAQLWGPSKLRAEPDKRYPREHGPFVVDPRAGGFNDRFVCACCGAGRERVNGGFSAPCYLTPRYALQSLGTGWGRASYLDVWIDLALRDVAAALDGHPYKAELGVSLTRMFLYKGAVIPDMRYLNEMQKARLKQTALVRVRRRVDDRGGVLDGACAEHWRTHSSETEQGALPDDFFDALFENRGPVEDVPKLVQALLGRLRAR